MMAIFVSLFELTQLTHVHTWYSRQCNFFCILYTVYMQRKLPAACFKLNIMPYVRCIELQPLFKISLDTHRATSKGNRHYHNSVISWYLVIMEKNCLGNHSPYMTVHAPVYDKLTTQSTWYLVLLAILRKKKVMQ